MAATENRRIKMTKKLLKDALVSLLAQKDIYHISIRELCAAADVNRTTFYKYYGSQFDLLSDMEKDLLNLVKDVLAENQGKSEKIIAGICRYLEENLDLARLLVNNNADPSFPEKLFSTTALQNTITEYVRQFYHKQENDYMYGFLTYGSYQAMRMWLNKDQRETPEEFAKILGGIIWR